MPSPPAAGRQDQALLPRVERGRGLHPRGKPRGEDRRPRALRTLHPADDGALHPEGLQPAPEPHRHRGLLAGRTLRRAVRAQAPARLQPRDLHERSLRDHAVPRGYSGSSVYFNNPLAFVPNLHGKPSRPPGARTSPWCAAPASGRRAASRRRSRSAMCFRPGRFPTNATSGGARASTTGAGGRNSVSSTSPGATRAERPGQSV